MTKLRLASCALFVFISILLFSGNILAQNARGVLEEMIVSATRDEQNNQEVAIAVSALSSESLDRGNITSVIDAGPVIPGLVVSSYNSAKPQFFIRGIGSTGTTAAEDSPIGVVADDVYLGRAGTNALDFLDLERVEVLRGPQGTLFGRNSAGGVVQLVSKKPTEDFDGYVDAGIGRFDRRALKGALGGELFKSESSSTLARLSLAYSERDGFVTNTTTGSENLRESEDIAGRLHLMQKWSNSSALLTFDYARSEQIGPSSRKASTDQNPLLFGGIVPLPQPVDDIYTTTLAVDAPTNRKTSGISLKVTVDTQIGEFVWISGWRNNLNDLFEDISGVGFILLGQDEEADHFTQEFRLSAKPTSSYQWTIGAYYIDENVERIDQVNLSPISDVFNLNPVVTVPDEVVFYDQDANTQSYALFSQAEIDLKDTLTLVAGGRYTKDKKQLSLAASGSDALGFGLLDAGPFTGSVREDFSQFTGRLSLNYAPTEDLLTYLSLSQGYKAGGFNGNAPSMESLQERFDAETANTLEWGVKSQWLKNKLRVNTAVFYTDYEDLQVYQVTNTGTQFISNAASATVEGAELEITALATDETEINLACTFLQNEYKNFISGVDDNADGMPDDLSGNRLTRSPKTACHIGLQYSPIIRGDNPLHLYLQYSWQDDIYITPQNRPLDTVDSYATLNLNMTYDITDQTTISLYGKNLTDEEYKLHAFDSDPVTKNNLQSSVYADPFTWGLSVRYKLK